MIDFLEIGARDVGTKFGPTFSPADSDRVKQLLYIKIRRWTISKKSVLELNEV
jgi:hypothetical protein